MSEENPRDKSQIDISTVKSNDPEVVDFKAFLENESATLSKIAELGDGYKNLFKLLITEPDNFLDKVANLFNDASIKQEELDEFIKKVTQITELIELEKKTLQAKAELQLEGKAQEPEYSFEEKETELQMLNQKIIGLTKALKSYHKILDKLK